jgi:D-beta-D-heptose 7-phosphate kinase/D-beta-D-heptose 1-phosphate adenosyltransferase
MTESETTQQQTQFNVLVIGDACLDIYQYGTIDRLSPEAPVPVFVPTHKEEREGMAGNVARNLEALGCKVNLLYGKRSTKTRLIDSRSKQQIARIDEDAKSYPLEIVTALPPYDAVVISDYAKGTVTYELMEEIIQQSESGIKFPVFIDTKKTDIDRLQGAWVKINELEYGKIKSECSGLIVTRGAKGASVLHHHYHCPAPKVEVVDVTGAGDTFLAALTVEYLKTKSITKSINFAVQASAVTVQHLGVYAPTQEEITCGF